MINNKGLSKLETIIIIFLVSILLLIGISFAINITTNKKVDTFKKDSISIINASKNIYGNLERKQNQHIVTSNEGISTAVCITLEGLKENNYLKNEYKNWEGYIVVEKDLNNNFNYIAWLTNGKYIIDGYSLKKIDELNFKNKTLLKGDKIELPHKSFTGTDKEKGGLEKNTNYIQECINEKIE